MSRYLFIAVLLLAACQSTPEPTGQPVALARIIGFWQPVSDTLAGDPQAWQFFGAAGDPVRVRVLGEGAVLTLTGAGGAVLGQGTDVQAILPTDGVYTITLAGSGRYELGVSYTDRPNPFEATPTPLPQVVAVPTPTPPYYADLGTLQGALRGGETRDGAFAGAGEQHVYTFDGREGQYITLRMNRVSGAADPVMTLYAPGGAALAMDDDSGGDDTAVLRNIRLPGDGVYSVQARGGGFAGAYRINLLAASAPLVLTPTVIVPPTETPVVEILTPTLAAAPNDTRLADHVPVLGRVDRPGGVARYSLYAAAGEPVTLGVDVAAGSSLLPRLELVGPSGEVLAQDSGIGSSSGAALIPAFSAPEAGVYQVYITGERGTTGAFIAAYGTGPSREDVRRGRAEPDRPYTGSLIRRGARDVWSLYLRQDDVINAAVQPLNALLDPALELVGPSGATVARDDNSGGGRDALIAAGRAPVTGLYTLRVTAADAAMGDYTLVWRYVNLAPSPTPPPARLPVLTVDDFAPQETYRFYPFQAQAGDVLEIYAAAPAGSRLDPVLALIGPDGAVLAEADDTDGLNPRLVVTLSASGTYTARVNGYLSAGAFVLMVTRLL